MYSWTDRYTAQLFSEAPGEKTSSVTLHKYTDKPNTQDVLSFKKNMRQQLFLFLTEPDYLHCICNKC